MKSILIGLLFMSWIAWSPCYSQTGNHDSTYCLPLSKARRLVEMAFQSRFADSLNNILSQRVALLDMQNKSQYSSFTNLLKLSEDKYTLQKENTGHMERLALSYKGERDYYVKREKKQRRKKNVLGGALVVVIILSLIK